MTLQEFKKKAGIDTIELYKGKEKSLYAATPIGMLFVSDGTKYNPKAKIQDVQQGFDRDGRQIWKLSNTKRVAVHKV